MRGWPAYAEKQKRRLVTNSVLCVTIIRDPLSRLKSLYTYARSGGEHWFRYESGIMRQLRNSTLSLKESLIDVYWDAFGKDYLMQSHEYLMANLFAHRCQPVRLEDLSKNFDGEMFALLHKQWKIKETH